jgi:hypothetical protein
VDDRHAARCLHELAHLRRLISGSMRWASSRAPCRFHPLVWVAARKLRTESEARVRRPRAGRGTRRPNMPTTCRTSCGALRARTPAVAFPCRAARVRGAPRDLDRARRQPTRQCRRLAALPCCRGLPPPGARPTGRRGRTPDGGGFGRTTRGPPPTRRRIPQPPQVEPSPSSSPGAARGAGPATAGHGAQRVARRSSADIRYGRPAAA